MSNLFAPPSDGLPRRTELVALAAILIVAALLRLVLIDSVPPGISHDEAMYGLDARDVVQQGVRPIYFERNNGGREPLFIYLGAAMMAIIGPTPLAMHLTSVLVGLATIVAGWLCFRSMFGPRVALFASSWLAINFWHVTLSRSSFRAITLPLVLTLALWLLWLAFSGRRWAWPVGGALFGLVQYTYFSDRAVPLLLLAFLAYLAVFHRPVLLANWRGLTVYLAVAALVFLPLGIYYLGRPDIFFSRFEQVSGVGAIDPTAPESPWVNVVNALGMFSVRGDELWGRNIANRPVFDVIGAAFFYLGVIIAATRLRRPAYGLLACWIGVMILPTALSTSAPHYLRAVGLIPAIFAVPAVGLDWLIGRARTVPRPAVAAVLALWFVGTAGTVSAEYFGYWARQPQVYYGFHSEMNAIGRYLNSVAGDPLVVLSSRYYQHPSTLLLLNRPLDLRWTNGAQSIVLPRTDRDVLFVIPDSARPPLTLFSDASRVASEPGPDGTTAFAAYRLGGREVTALADFQGRDTLGTFQGDAASVRLRDVRTDAPVSPGDRLRLTTTWTVDSISDRSRDYAWFVHLIDRQGRRYGIGDANEYLTLEWQPGDTVVSWFDVAVQADAPPGAYRLSMGLYDRRTGERLGDGVIVGDVKVLSRGDPDPPSQSIGARFGSAIQLVGYDLSAADCASACTRDLRLVWRADQAVRQDYTVFIHILDANGTQIVTADGPPAQGDRPTRQWDAGDVISDMHRVPIPAGAARIAVGLYDPVSGARLPMAGGDSVLIPLGPR